MPISEDLKDKSSVDSFFKKIAENPEETNMSSIFNHLKTLPKMASICDGLAYRAFNLRTQIYSSFLTLEKQSGGSRVLSAEEFDAIFMNDFIKEILEKLDEDEDRELLETLHALENEIIEAKKAAKQPQEVEEVEEVAGDAKKDEVLGNSKLITYQNRW